MIDYMITVSTVFAGPPGATDDDFERFLSATVTEFGKISDGDLSIGASLAKRTADFSVIIPGVNEREALARYLVDLRTALHAAGCSTPDWPPFAISEQHVRELQPA